MKIPAALNKTEVTKIKLIFSAEFEILNILGKVLGEEKLMVSSNMWGFFLTVFYTGHNHSGLWDLFCGFFIFSVPLYSLWIYDSLYRCSKL